MKAKFRYRYEGDGPPSWVWVSNDGAVSGSIPASDAIYGVTWAEYPGHVVFAVTYEGAARRVELYRIAALAGTAELIATINLPRDAYSVFKVVATDITDAFGDRKVVLVGEVVGAAYRYDSFSFLVWLDARTVEELQNTSLFSDSDVTLAWKDYVYQVGYNEGGVEIRSYYENASGGFSFEANKAEIVPNRLVADYMDYNPSMYLGCNGVSPNFFIYFSDFPDVDPEDKFSIWELDLVAGVSRKVLSNVDPLVTNAALTETGFVLSTTSAYGEMTDADRGVMFSSSFWVNFLPTARPNFFNSFVSCVEKPGLKSESVVPQTPPPTGLTNDHIANAIDLTLNAADWDVTARPFHDFIFPGHTLVGATFEAGEPPTDRGYPFPADTGSVWFKFTVPDFGVPINFATAMVNYTVDPVTGLGVTFPPFKAYAEIFTSDGTIVGTDRTVYGGSTDSWTALWDWADNERVVVVMDVWPVAPGQEYYVRVTSFGANPDHPQSANYGPFDLCLEFVQQYVNQDVFAFETPIQLSPLPAQNVSYTWPDFYYIWNDPFTLEAWESTAYALPQPGATTIEPGTGSAWLAFTLPSFDARPRRLSVTPSFDLDLGGEVYNPSDFLFFIEIFDMDKNNVTTSMRPFDATLVADHAVHRLGYYGVLDMVASGAIYYVRVTSYGVNPASPTPAVFGELRLSVNLDLV